MRAPGIAGVWITALGIGVFGVVAAGGQAAGGPTSAATGGTMGGPMNGSASSASTGGSGGGQSTAPPSHPARVRVKLDGFDVAPQSTHGVLTPAKRGGANQIGGVSRGLGVKLYAPEKGLAYSLHPTFLWSGSADAKYKLKIEDLAEQTSFEVDVQGTSFAYPENAPALKAGSTYLWTVTPEVDIMGGASDPALIVIAGGPERDKIEDALSAIPQTGDENARARAKVFFDKRIWYDSQKDYSALIAAHPEDAELRKMRGTLYDQVAATQKLADADFAAAGTK